MLNECLLKMHAPPIKEFDGGILNIIFQHIISIGMLVSFSILEFKFQLHTRCQSSTRFIKNTLVYEFYMFNSCVINLHKISSSLKLL